VTGVPHLHVIRVRYAETDKMGVAHHSAYVAWLEEARIEWLRARGIAYRELEGRGVLMPVIELSIAYRRSLTFDDAVELTTIAVAKGPSRVEFTTEVRLRGDPEARAIGRVTVAAVSPEGKPVRLPPEVQAAFG
jgi:acyl-CoA thioester hydrolase